MPSINAIVQVAALFILTAIAVSDVRRRIVPNELVLLTAAAGITLRLLNGGSAFWISLAAAAAVYLSLGTLAHANLIGGGDAKLISAVTFLVSPIEVLSLLLAIALAGGVLSLAWLLRRWATTLIDARQPARASAGCAPAPESDLDATRQDTLPYAVAVFGGCAAHFVFEGVRCLYATSCLP